jgi:hypothetical protein
VPFSASLSLGWRSMCKDDPGRALDTVTGLSGAGYYSLESLWSSPHLSRSLIIW